MGTFSRIFGIFYYLLGVGMLESFCAALSILERVFEDGVAS